VQVLQEGKFLRAHHSQNANLNHFRILFTASTNHIIGTSVFPLFGFHTQTHTRTNTHTNTLTYLDLGSWAKNRSRLLLAAAAPAATATPNQDRTPTFVLPSRHRHQHKQPATIHSSPPLFRKADRISSPPSCFVAHHEPGTRQQITHHSRLHPSAQRGPAHWPARIKSDSRASLVGGSPTNPRKPPSKAKQSKAKHRPVNHDSRTLLTFTTGKPTAPRPILPHLALPLPPVRPSVPVSSVRFARH
jgi:hypothetical protein